MTALSIQEIINKLEGQYWTDKGQYWSDVILEGLSEDLFLETLERLQYIDCDLCHALIWGVIFEISGCEKLSGKKLSEGFIEKYKDFTDWFTISTCQVLSEGFIEKHQYEVDWSSISACQVLSEGFIEKHSDKLDWECISENQNLSEDFIQKHSDKIDWERFFVNKKIPQEIRTKYKNIQEILE